MSLIPDIIVRIYILYNGRLGLFRKGRDTKK